MNDSVMPDRPAYWSRCEEVGFDPLRRFMHDSLERRSNSAADDDGFPRSEEEFLELCDMLGAKADALKQHTPMTKRPEYDGPPSLGWGFEPSPDLKRLYAARGIGPKDA